MPSATDTSVTLLAFGRRGYGLAASNLVRSLRHHGFGGRINALVTEQLSPHLSVFDDVTITTINGDTSPGLCKLMLPDMITGPTLYIDVDSIAIGDITPLVEALAADGRDFITSVQGKGPANGERIRYYNWAEPSTTVAIEGFADDATLYGIQSSWMFMRPGPTLWSIAEAARASYQRWSVRDLKHLWGGGKPDELFWGNACTRVGHDPSWHSEPMWHGSGLVSHGEIKDKYVLMSIPGQTQTMSQRALRIYDAEVRHFYGHKAAYIFSDKSVNFKNQPR
jgi:hypothetical protein